MSKSLKNFITIDMALSGGPNYEFPVLTPRQLRLLFLSHRYTGPMEFTSELINETIVLDRHFLRILEFSWTIRS